MDKRLVSTAGVVLFSSLWVASCSSPPSRTSTPNAAAASSSRETKEFNDIQNAFYHGPNEALLQRISAFEKRYPSASEFNQVENFHGLVLLMLHHPQPAVLHFRRALGSGSASGLSTSSFNQYVLYNLASAQFEAGQMEDAQQTSQEIHGDQLDRDNRIKLFNLRARIAIQRGDWAEAARASLGASRLLTDAQVQEMRDNRGNFGALLQQSLSALQNQAGEEGTMTLANLYGEFEDSPLADVLLFALGSQELKRGEAEQGQTHLRALMSRFPQSPYYAQAADLLKVDEARAATEPMTVGVLLPMQGKFSKFGNGSLHGIELAFHIFNAAEPDTKVKLVMADSGDDAEQAVQALTNLVEKEHVIAVIGPLLSKGIDQVTAKAQELRVPLLSLARNTGTPGDYVFQAGMTLRMQAREVARYAVDNLGFKKFAILYPHDKVGEQASQEFWDAVESLGGQVTGIEPYASGETDFRQPVDKLSGLYYTEARQRELDELAKLREENKIRKRTRRTEKFFSLPPIVDYQAVFIPEEPKVTSQILPTFAYRDVDHVTFLGTSAWDTPELISRAQSAVEGAVFVDAFVPEAHDAQAEKFRQKFTATFGEEPSTMDAIAFDAAQVLEAALSQGSTDSRAELRDRLKAVKDLPGATGKISYSDGQFLRSLKILTVKGGHIVPASSSAAAATVTPTPARPTAPSPDAEE